MAQSYCLLQGIGDPSFQAIPFDDLLRKRLCFFTDQIVYDDLIQLTGFQAYGIEAGPAYRPGADTHADVRSLPRQVAGAYSRDTAGPHRADQVARHQRDGFAGFCVVQHDHQHGTRQASARVRDVRAVPLHAGDVEAPAEVAGHG